MNTKKVKLLCLYTILILIPIVISVIFCYSIELPKEKPLVENKSVLDIFFHNIIIAIFLIILTDFIAIPILFINSLYLGLILGSIIRSTNIEYVLASTMHIPFELIGWILVIYFSRSFRINLHRVIRKEKCEIKPLIKKVLILLLPCYILGAFIEGLEIYLILKGNLLWIN